FDIASPRNTNTVSFDTTRPLVEVSVRVPHGVHLSCAIFHDRTSALVEYDIDRKLWHYLFRP
ncbi:unnamed protein product, partial [Rotaria magnacalcarata]